MGFIEGVLASLVAAAILALFAVLRARVRPYSSLRLAFTVLPRMSRAGITNVFASRDEYVRRPGAPTVAQYMETAEASLVYVGFWLAQASEIEDLRRTLRALLDRRVRVSLVLLNAELDEAQAEKVAAVLALDVDRLRSRLRDAWTAITAFRAALPDDVRPRLTLRSHEEHLQASAFLFDRGRDSAKTLMDVKLYGIGRQGSLGLELRPTVSGGSTLYERVTDSFANIEETSDLVLEVR
jgi:hypothetical protein